MKLESLRISRRPFHRPNESLSEAAAAAEQSQNIVSPPTRTGAIARIRRIYSPSLLPNFWVNGRHRHLLSAAYIMTEKWDCESRSVDLTGKKRLVIVDFDNTRNSFRLSSR